MVPGPPRVQPVVDGRALGGTPLDSHARCVHGGPTARGLGVIVTRLALGVVMVVLLAGCTANGAADQDRVAELEGEVAVAADRIARLEQRVEDLQRELDEVRDDVTPSEPGAPDVRAEPPSELDYADDVPRPEPRPIVFEGGDATTRPRSLSGGDYAVTVATLGDCLFFLGLQQVDGERRPLPSVQGSDTVEGLLDGLPAGDWYVDGVVGPPCTWTVTLTPR